MKSRTLAFVAWMLLVQYGAVAQRASGTASISGTIRHADTRESLPSVNVRIVDTPFGGVTDEEGRFGIDGLPAGSYLLRATAVGHRPTEIRVTLSDGQRETADLTMTDEAVKASEVMVYGASLRRERITDAPSAVTTLDAAQIVQRAGAGQLPKLLESEPGIDITQSGLFDFNINTRGFNSSLNRRVLVLLDGRDLGTAFLGATEWNGLSTPLEEMGRIEMIRGPGSALYGANAFNGVMNITSLTPRTSQGTKVILGAGEMSMYRVDVRHAGAMGSVSYRVNAGRISGNSFSKNRSWGKDSAFKNVFMSPTSFEYPGMTPGLNTEAVILPDGPVSSTYGSARVDYDFEDGSVGTVEGGMTLVMNETIVTGIGRVQAQEATRPWVRAHVQTGGLSANFWTNGRHNRKPDLSLSTGLPLTQDAQISQGEVQYSFAPLDGLFVVAGASQRFVSIDTKGSLMTEPRDDDMTGVFAQAEYRIFETLKGVAAIRWDRSSLHPSQISPKAALVWSPSPAHTIRATFNQAFQSPNYSELYLNVKHPLRKVIYLGNEDLLPERITGFELGYKGVFGESLFLTVEAYFNMLEEFVTDLGPGVNPKYLGPIAIPNDTLATGEVSLTRQVWSYTNAGEVNESGFDLGVNYYVSDEILLEGNFSYFTFEVVSRHPNDVLLPNAPRYKANAGVTYTSPLGFDLSAKVKHIPEFSWAAGIYRGTIKAYTLLGLSASYAYSSSLSFSLNVSNALDSRHYEIFGGSLLGRRSVVTATYGF